MNFKKMGGMTMIAILIAATMSLFALGAFAQVVKDATAAAPAVPEVEIASEEPAVVEPVALQSDIITPKDIVEEIVIIPEDDTDDMDDEDETPLTGDVLTQATNAALAYFGQPGQVVESEMDEDATYGIYYEVEVILEDGTEAEVYMDTDFNILAVEIEDEEEYEEDYEDEEYEDDDYEAEEAVNVAAPAEVQSGASLDGTVRILAIDAALSYLQQGEILAATAGDDGTYYQVDVLLNDESEVEVFMDLNYNVLAVGTEQNPIDSFTAPVPAANNGTSYQEPAYDEEYEDDDEEYEEYEDDDEEYEDDDEEYEEYEDDDEDD